MVLQSFSILNTIHSTDPCKPPSQTLNLLSSARLCVTPRSTLRPGRVVNITYVLSSFPILPPG